MTQRRKDSTTQRPKKGTTKKWMEGNMAPKKFVFAFEEGDGKNKKLLGGKGANLCEMTQIGLPVPPGFVISTEACLAYLEQKTKGLPPLLMEEVKAAMAELQKKAGKGFGSPENPP